MSHHLKSELRRPAISGAWSNPYNAARKGREAEAYITQLEARVREQDAEIETLRRALAASAGTLATHHDTEDQDVRDPDPLP